MIKFSPASAPLLLALGACSTQVVASDSTQPCIISATGPYAQSNSCDVKATVTYRLASGQSVFTTGYGNDIYEGVDVVVRFDGTPTVASYSSNASGVQGGITALHQLAGENVLWRALVGNGLSTGEFGFAFNRVDVDMQWPDSTRYIVHGDLSSTLQAYALTHAPETVSAKF